MLLFSVKELAGRGRGLVASQTIRKGSVALEDTAFAAVLNHGRAADDHCSFCFAPAADAADGGHCSAACKENSFASHDRLLDKCDLGQLGDGASRYPRLIARMTAAALLTGPKFNDYWSMVLSLAAPNTRAQTHLEAEFDALQRAFEPAIGADATETIFAGPLPLEWYARLIGILHVNSIGMGQRDLGVQVADMNSASQLAVLQQKAAKNPDIGVGLFPTASLLNHSCEPNCEMFRSFSKHSPTCVFVAARHIEEGEELTISYLPDVGTKPVHERKEYLEYNYGFQCECPLCQSTTT